ncbi:MAG TPA: response regulator transcription factor [Ktedonobacterales bacterium]|nr:response regulator transcription factor [Ktedonobacterales bacterium]
MQMDPVTPAPMAPELSPELLPDAPSERATSVSAAPGAVTPVRVVVVDDQLLLREGIATLLELDDRITVIGRGSNGQDAIDLARSLTPDVVLVDIRMPIVDGIEAIREIKASNSSMYVVILTSFVYDGYVVEGLMAGADGYLLKDASPAALISGVLAVAAGEQVIEPGVARHVADMLGKQSQDRRGVYDGLTPRELQMLAMIARGFVAKEIAHTLHISEKTVRNHVSNIYRKLDIYDRSQAVLYAIKKGLIAPE